jgi:hypothetical protein
MRASELLHRGRAREDGRVGRRVLVREGAAMVGGTVVEVRADGFLVATARGVVWAREVH